MTFSPYHEFDWTDCWFLLQGAGRTVLLTLAAGVLATVLGPAVGWLRFASRAARILTTPLIDVLRSVPRLRPSGCLGCSRRQGQSVLSWPGDTSAEANQFGC